MQVSTYRPLHPAAILDSQAETALDGQAIGAIEAVENSCRATRSYWGMISRVGDIGLRYNLLEDNCRQAAMEELEEMYTEAQLIEAHQHSADHKREIEASHICGCFYCQLSFPPEEINKWIEHEGTALCPRCGIESVIGSASGYQITERFLAEMYESWFIL